MHTWIKRSLGVAAITGGVLLAGAATAHADDGSRPSTTLSAPVEIAGVSIELGHREHTTAPRHARSSSSERGLDVEVGRTTAKPTARLGATEHRRPAVEVEAPVDLRKVEAELGHRHHTGGTHHGRTTHRTSERGLDVDLRDLTADPTVRAGGHDGLDVTAPVDLRKVEAELGSRHRTGGTHHGRTTHRTSERGLGLDVGRLTADPVVGAGGEEGLLVDVPVALDGVDLGLGRRDTRTSGGADGTTTSTTESGLGLELGDLDVAPTIGAGGDSGLTVALPVSLDGLELGLGTRETSTSSPGDDAPTPGDGTPGDPAPLPDAPGPVTPAPGDQPGRGGDDTDADDDRPTTGTTPGTGTTTPGSTTPGTGTTTPGTTTPGTGALPGTTAPGTGAGPGAGGQPSAVWPEGLLDALLRTVVGDLGRLVRDVADELTGQVPFVTDPGTTPGPDAPQPTEPGTGGDHEEPGTGGTPPAEGPDCGCNQQPEVLPEVEDTVDTVTDTVADTTRDVTETVDTVVETTTGTVSDVVDTVTDTVDDVTGSVLGGSSAEHGGQDDGDC
jgi:hypothetical protein